MQHGTWFSIAERLVKAMHFNLFKWKKALRKKIIIWEYNIRGTVLAITTKKNIWGAYFTELQDEQAVCPISEKSQ